jgi:S-adenosylmethionine:tRNA ribosyltransferase-isomerase
MPEPLAVWDTWTPFAGMPAAFEAPSAGFALDWATIGALRARGALFATLTHAAGISSTGDPDLDGRLPFDEPYYIPRSTAALIEDGRQRGGRVIAIGTTVVRALEDAAFVDGTVRGGFGIATRRVGPLTALRCVDALVSGTHEPGTSHFELLGAFQDADVLRRMQSEAEARGYRTHEIGDSVFIERDLTFSPRRPRSTHEGILHVSRGENRQPVASARSGPRGADSPDPVTAIIGDEQAAIAGDRDADRTFPA